MPDDETCIVKQKDYARLFYDPRYFYSTCESSPAHAVPHRGWCRADFLHRLLRQLSYVSPTILCQIAHSSTAAARHSRRRFRRLLPAG